MFPKRFIIYTILNNDSRNPGEEQRQQVSCEYARMISLTEADFARVPFIDGSEQTADFELSDAQRRPQDAHQLSLYDRTILVCLKHLKNHRNQHESLHSFNGSRKPGIIYLSDLEGQPDGVQCFSRPTHHGEGDHKLPDVHRVVFILLRHRPDGNIS